MALTAATVDELVEAADGDFDQLVKLLKTASAPIVDGDWVWKTPSGRQVRIDDLAIEVIERIAQQHGLDWMTLMRFPCSTGTMAWDLYLECCKFASEEPVDRPENAGGFLEFTELFDRVPKDRATTFGEEGVPLEGDPSTA